MGINIHRSLQIEDGAKPSRVVPVVMAHDDAFDRSKVKTQHQGIIDHRFSLTGIQQVVSAVGFHENGKTVFSHRPRVVKHTIFADYCGFYLHMWDLL